MRAIIRFFDKLEDKIRNRFSHYPIYYGVVGGIGVVLFWRGVWHTMDYLMLRFSVWSNELSSTDLSNELWWDGPLSFLIGSTMLLMTGLFVSSFIGNEVIISGLRGEKKVSEKTEREVKKEGRLVYDTKREVKKIAEKLDRIVVPKKR